MAEVSANEAYLPLEYGNIELPQFSGNLEAVRTLDLSFEDLMSSSELSESGLDQLQASFALRKIDAIIAAYVTKAAKVLQKMRNIGNSQFLT